MIKLASNYKLFLTKENLDLILLNQTYFTNYDFDNVYISDIQVNSSNQTVFRVVIPYSTLSNGNINRWLNFNISYDPITGKYIRNGSFFNGNSEVVTNVQSVEITDNIFYHPQITDILVTFFILAIVLFYFPYKIFSRAFGRWLKI